MRNTGDFSCCDSHLITNRRCWPSFCLERDPAAGNLFAVAGSKNSVTSIFTGFGKNWQLSMASIIQPLLALLASLTRQELARQVIYLRAENQILRSKLSEQIALSNQERRKLVGHGKPLGARIKDLISIVSYSTLRKRVRQMEDGAPAAKSAEGKPAAPPVPGRPKTEESVRDLILRIRSETG